MPSWIDGTLYPETAIPERIETLEDRVDFLSRVCAAWDFGILPEAETLAEIRRPEWRAAIEATRLLTSIAYRVLRNWHGLPQLPYLGTFAAELRDDPQLNFV
jgi:hypothetical protein